MGKPMSLTACSSSKTPQKSVDEPWLCAVCRTCGGHVCEAVLLVAQARLAKPVRLVTLAQTRTLLSHAGAFLLWAGKLRSDENWTPQMQICGCRNVGAPHALHVSWAAT